MNARDRVKLLFGPYKAPALRRGDRATCLLRDCTVVITSWSSARIPWPRCRALDGTGGGSGLLLDEELARAVRHESAAAVMYWWGASKGAVERWRRVLGVGRTDNEGIGGAMTESPASPIGRGPWGRRRQPEVLTAPG